MPPTRPAPLKTSGPHINIRTTHLSVPFSPLPSEIPRTPIAGTPIFDLKTPLTAEALKTPITPPAAYTDFLKATINSPAVASPRSSFSGTLPYSPATAAAPNYKTGGLTTPLTPYTPKEQPAKKKRCTESGSEKESAAKSRSPDTDGRSDEPRSPKSLGSEVVMRDADAVKKEGEEDADKKEGKREIPEIKMEDVKSEPKTDREEQEFEAAKDKADEKWSASEPAPGPAAEPKTTTLTTRTRSQAAGQVTVKQIVKTTVTYTPPAMSLMPAPKGKRRRGD